jgi:hypothetical protein
MRDSFAACLFQVAGCVGDAPLCCDMESIAKALKLNLTRAER